MIDLKAIAKDAAQRVHKNGGCVPKMAFAPILFALQDALSTTPARAEAQDEGAAGEIYKQALHPRDGSKFVEPLDEALPRIAAAMDEAKSIGAEYAQVYVRQGDLRSLLNVVRRAHPSPTPAADADRVRDV